jgi:hypothetical protein
LVTDNKTIHLIFSNPKSKPSDRIERFGLRLVPFSFKIRHETGSTNIADFISRNAIHETIYDYVEQYVNMLVHIHSPLMIKLDTVRSASNEDPTLNLGKRFISGRLYMILELNNMYRSVQMD